MFLPRSRFRAAAVSRSLSSRSCSSRRMRAASSNETPPRACRAAAADLPLIVTSEAPTRAGAEAVFLSIPAGDPVPVTGLPHRLQIGDFDGK